MPGPWGRLAPALGLGSGSTDPILPLQFMASHGNDAARDKYESKVPPFYYRPTFSDCQ